MITNPFSHIGQFGALSDDLAGNRYDSGHQAAAVGAAVDTVGPWCRNLEAGNAPCGASSC
jgi:hypothetical protein